MPPLTGMVRTIDLRRPSNRLVAFVTLVAAAVTFAAAPVEDRIGTTIGVAGSAFLGWALARELDPDRTLTAAVAAPASALVAWFDAGAGHLPSLGALYLILASVRLLVRTTGLYPTMVDLAVHVALATWLATMSIAWLAAVALAVAVILDTRLPDPAPSHHVWWGAAIGMFATVAAGLTGDTPRWSGPATIEWVPMAAGLAGAILLVQPEPVMSITDYRARPLDPHRLRAGRLLAVAAAATIALVGGARGVAGIGAVWVAFAAAGLLRIIRARGRS